MKYHQKWKSPVGPLHIVATEDKLIAIVFGEKWDSKHQAVEEDSEIIAKTIHQLEEYFSGKRKTFKLPLSIEGTALQLAAWKALETIPYGETRSYQQQARLIGRASAVRAVGSANGRNPLPIVIPCHRVIGKNGSLTGYGGGVEIKRKLLALEGVRVAR